MKVIIVGAGISGLTFGAALGQLAPQHEVELYEGDASAADRRRSYAIGLKGETGLAVLERLGLRDEVLADGAQQVTNFVITDRLGTTLLALPSGKDESRHTYRVERDHLRSVLAEALPDRQRQRLAARRCRAPDRRKAVLESRRSPAVPRHQSAPDSESKSRFPGRQCSDQLALNTRKAAVQTTSVR